MTFGAEIVTRIFVQSQIELGTMLNHRLVERGQQHMIVVVNSGHRHHKKTVIFPGITINNSSAVIGSQPIRSKHLTSQRLFQVYHYCLVKSKITHILYLGFKFFAA